MHIGGQRACSLPGGGLCSILRNGCGGRIAAVQERGNILAGVADDGDGFGHGHHIAFFIEKLQNRAGGGGIYGNGKLIGFHFEKRFALFYLITFGLQPFGDNALGHLQTLLGQYDLLSHA